VDQTAAPMEQALGFSQLLSNCCQNRVTPRGSVTFMLQIVRFYGDHKRRANYMTLYQVCSVQSTGVRKPFIYAGFR
jgi:hypothetical protein